MNSFIDIACVILAIGLLHSLSRRVAERTCSNTRDLLPTDTWIIYSVLFTSELVISFHVVGFAALATGANLVHSSTVMGVLAMLWSADRLLFGAVQPKTGIHSLTGAIEHVRQVVRRLDPLVRWSAVVGGGIFVLFFVEAATRPPEGWDAMVYHLPLAVKWLQQGSLAFIWESWKFQMPSNGELIPLFFMYLGNERIVSLACVPFTFLAMLAVYNLAYRLSGSYEGAALAALGFGTLPIVLYHTFSIAADMFATSFFLSSIYLLFRMFQTGETSRSLIAIAGLAFGLGLGARYIYAPLALFMTSLCLAASMKKRPPLHFGWSTQGMVTTMTFVACSFLPAAFWYVRNFMASGNPMYPLQFSVGAHGISASIKKLSERSLELTPPVRYDNSCLIAGDRDPQNWLVAPWEDCWYAGADHFSENWGLGPVFAAFVPTIALAMIVIALVTTVRRRQFHPVLFLSLVVITLLTYWWKFLFTLARSLFPVMGILFACVALGVGLFSPKGRRCAYGLFLCAMVINGVLLAAKPLKLLSNRVHHHTWSRSEYYEVPALIDELPPSSVLLNASYELQNYPLFGRHWQNRVVTDRALLEPTLTVEIGEDFIKKWGVQYIYYDSRQKWRVHPSIIREVMLSREIDDEVEKYEQVLYRVGLDARNH